MATHAMIITDEMLQAAARKAIEAGLLPRNACREDANASKELMRLIVQAALSAEPRGTFLNGTSMWDGDPVRAGCSTKPDVKRASPSYAYS